MNQQPETQPDRVAGLTNAYRSARSELLTARPGPGVRGIGLVVELTSLTLDFVKAVAAEHQWPAEWALLATGGTGRGELCPGSDLDLLLIHPKKLPDAEVAAFGEPLWYPLWNAGLTVAPSVHTVESAIELGEREVLSALSWMDAAHVAGDRAVTDRFVHAAAASRRKQAKRQFAELVELTRQRHSRLGDVAFLLGPDLRDGRGGLRDLLVLRWVASLGSAELLALQERDPAELTLERDTLLGVRAELHRCTGRPHDVLALQEQDAVASALGMTDADALLAAVSASAAHHCLVL